MQNAMALRTALLERGCSFTAEISAHLDDGTAEFTLDCTCAPDGTASLCVTDPDSVAGITATVQPGARTASFNDVALDFGLLADGQLAPLAIPQLLYSCWTQEYLREAGKDGERISAVYLSGWGDRELTVEQWLEADGTPVHADLWFGTRNAAEVQIRDFAFLPAEQ